ncbi:MAG: hypothetical protein HQ541_02275 [Mariniphaga sp.]|nr:hypothetical protein [Mariniphaga sp.]
MKTFQFILLAVIVLFCSQYLIAQEKDKVQVRIMTNDGNEYIGEVIGEDSLKLDILTQNLGELSISKNNISGREEIKKAQFKEGKYWFENPQATRYFWSPNGFGLKPGEGYYQNIWVLWNQFAIGISENFSIGGGIIPLFLFDGSPTPVFVTPKFSIPVQEKLNLGVGALLGTILVETESSFGILYGLSTFGTRDNNATIGLGYGFAAGSWASSPMINFNAMFRTGSRGYFITENYYIDGTLVLMAGGRWIIKKAALDFGLVIPTETGGLIAIPWLGFTVPIGNTQ